MPFRKSNLRAEPTAGWYCRRCDTRSWTTPPILSLDQKHRIGLCPREGIKTAFAYRDPGEEAKQRGMAAVETAEAITNPGWTARADAAIRSFAFTGQQFSAEDVARIAGRPDRPNAMGARISAAARAGLIVKAGFAPAERPERHRNEMRLWRGAQPGV